MDEMFTDSDISYGRRQIQRKKSKKIRNIMRAIFIILLCVISLSAIKLFPLTSQEEKSIKDSKVESKEKTDKNIANKRNVDDQNAEVIRRTKANDWRLVLVNSSHKLTKDYNLSVKQLNNGHAIDERAYDDLQAMMDDCRAAGLAPVICSSYRTMEKQESLFANQINKFKKRGYSEEKAKVEAAKWVAVPGTSEHQLGLALDIVASSNQMLNESQEKTTEQQWLMKNCYKYGFILRYPKDKTEITEIEYEPWHYRYVGKEAAAEITKKGICLEEYLKE